MKSADISPSNQDLSIKIQDNRPKKPRSPIVQLDNNSQVEKDGIVQLAIKELGGVIISEVNMPRVKEIIN